MRGFPRLMALTIEGGLPDLIRSYARLGPRPNTKTSLRLGHMLDL